MSHSELLALARTAMGLGQASTPDEVAALVKRLSFALMTPVTDSFGIGDGGIVLLLARRKRIAQVVGGVTGCALGRDCKPKDPAQLAPETASLLIVAPV